MKSLNSKKRVFLNSILYSVTTILQKAIGFFLIPLYTIFLTPADYGVVNLVSSFVSMIALIGTLSLDSAINRFYFDFKDNHEKLKRFWGTIIVFIMFNSFVLTTILILFNKILVLPFVSGVTFYPYILVGILTIFVGPLYSIYQSILQTTQDARTYSINSLINFLMALSLNILFIVFLKYQALGLLLSSLVTATIFSMYSIYSLLKKDLIKLTFNFTYFKEAIKYSIPIIPHSVSGPIANFASKFFLNQSSNLINLGLLNISYQFISIVAIIQSSINRAYVPWLFGMMSQDENKEEVINHFAILILKLYFIIHFLLGVFIKEIIQVMTPNSYTLSWTVLPIMVISYQILGIYFFYANAIFYDKKATRYIFIATLSSNLLSIIFSAVATPIFDLYTPAISQLISHVFTLVVVVIISKKFNLIQFNLMKMISYVVFLAITLCMALIYDYTNPLRPFNIYVLFFKFIFSFVVLVIILWNEFPMIKKLYNNLSIKNKLIKKD